MLFFIVGDGAIDKDEYMQCLSAFGICDSDSEEAFERIMEILPRNPGSSRWEKYIPKPDDDNTEKVSFQLLEFSSKSKLFKCNTNVRRGLACALPSLPGTK